MHLSLAVLRSRLPYLRLPLRKEDQIKTTFQRLNSAYMFAACPYGIKHIGSHFTRLMDSILGDLPFCLVYIDDVFCITQEDDMALHAEQLKTSINRLTDNLMILNIKKAHILLKQL